MLYSVKFSVLQVHSERVCSYQRFNYTICLPRRVWLYVCRKVLYNDLPRKKVLFCHALPILQKQYVNRGKDIFFSFNQLINISKSSPLLFLSVYMHQSKSNSSLQSSSSFHLDCSFFKSTKSPNTSVSISVRIKHL